MITHRPSHRALHRRQNRLDPSPHLVTENRSPSHDRIIQPEHASTSETRPSPADGTLVADSATGRVDEFAGGAPWYVDTWAGIDRVAEPATVVDDWNFAHMTDPLAHLRPVASDGTFVSGARTGRVYRVVAGIPFYVASWAPYRGPQLTTSIDQATIDHALLATLRRPIGPPPPGATGDPLRFRRP